MDYQLKEKTARAFSLLELLLVLTVASILMGMGAIALTGTLNAYRLSTSATQLKADIMYAAQLAQSKNRPVEIRFFKHSYLKGGYTDEEFRSYQFVEQDPDSGEFRAISALRFLDPGIVILPNKKYSTILALPILDAKENETKIGKIGPFATRYKYIRMVFRADGSLALSADRQWAITLANGERGAKNTMLPPGFRCLVVNPVTASVMVY